MAPSTASTLASVAIVAVVGWLNIPFALGSVGLGEAIWTFAPIVVLACGLAGVVSSGLGGANLTWRETTARASLGVLAGSVGLLVWWRGAEGLEQVIWVGGPALYAIGALVGIPLFRYASRPGRPTGRLGSKA